MSVCMCLFMCAPSTIVLKKTTSIWKHFAYISRVNEEELLHCSYLSISLFRILFVCELNMSIITKNWNSSTESETFAMQLVDSKRMNF